MKWNLGKWQREKGKKKKVELKNMCADEIDEYDENEENKLVKENT